MNKPFGTWSRIVVVLLLMGAWCAVPATAQNESGAVEVVQPVAHDVSPPLRDVKVPSPTAASSPHEKPLRMFREPGPPQADGAVQGSAGSAIATTAGLGFDGVGVTTGYAVNAAPPDTNGSVGATQYVQWVNEAFAVYDKATGNRIYGPAAGNTLFTGFSTGKCDTNNDGDPIALYDKAAGRWVMTQFSVTGGPPYFQCIAISTTSDATGSYYRYAYQFSNFNDYPKFGVWPDAYYASFNMFNGSSFAGATACAFDRTGMLAGAAAPTAQCFSTGSSYGGLLPSDLDGANAPPAGSPNYFVNFGTNVLNVWKFHVDWVNPANSTFGTAAHGPNQTISAASFTPACGNGGACIPQSGTSQQLDSLGDRLMYRLGYRHFADGHEALVVNHSVQVGSGKRSSYTGVRWYELRPSGGTVSLYQQGTFAPDSTSRWMGSIAMDKVGNIALGYSVSSGSIYPGVRYTGRVPSDPLGTMGAENTILDGFGSQLRNLARWGDYSSMSIDPTDDCTFWYTNEYLNASGTFNWSTRIASFKFPSCI